MKRLFDLEILDMIGRLTEGILLFLLERSEQTQCRLERCGYLIEDSL